MRQKNSSHNEESTLETHTSQVLQRMAQAELEEKFKGIGLAEATAKCELLLRLSASAAPVRIECAQPAVCPAGHPAKLFFVHAGLQSKTRS